MIFSAIEKSDLGFYITNFFPRKLLTKFFGKLSKSENPIVLRALFALFKLFSGSLNLEESKEQKFNTFHEYFIRELRSGARPIDHKASFVSPCDGIVGSFGKIVNNQLFQIKQEAYLLEELLCNDTNIISRFKNGSYLTLRIKPHFYHRFHMVCDAKISSTTLVPGELWNINEATLRKVSSLFAKNERAIINCESKNYKFAIIPVGTVLVGSIKLNSLDFSFNQDYTEIMKINNEFNATKGEELGMFHYGSTVVLLFDKEVSFTENILVDSFVKVGEKIIA
ncbi:MAG: archaetidylserine decarboxylase [Leptospiraceae bacterium]|nr:archaetidylserine decarboxylase [Leptospiraceae bacterium]